ncbi:MAG: GNAT family N-acetyltransferase [Synergistaceae bacterium]|nr:GNAT family N-acetyltransferase [Synergistaceae bacterium]
MKIKSERLLLYPASDCEMKQLVDDEQDSELKQAYSEMLEGCITNPESRIWFALWFIELKSQPGEIVGEFSFKGLNADGMVEIGYGLKDGYCGHGYMTEAVSRIARWALTQTGVTRLEAEADPDNKPSRNVLLNAGFTMTGETGTEGMRFVYR